MTLKTKGWSFSKHTVDDFCMNALRVYKDHDIKNVSSGDLGLESDEEKKKAEKVLTEQSTGLEVAQLYIDYIMLKNGINDKKQYLDDIRNALAMAKIRKLNGKCTPWFICCKYAYIFRNGSMYFTFFK